MKAEIRFIKAHRQVCGIVCVIDISEIVVLVTKKHHVSCAFLRGQCLKARATMTTAEETSCGFSFFFTCETHHLLEIGLNRPPHNLSLS